MYTMFMMGFASISEIHGYRNPAIPQKQSKLIVTVMYCGKTVNFIAYWGFC